MSSQDSETKLKERSVTREQCEKFRRLVYGELADFADPEFGVTLIQFNGYTFGVNAPGFIERLRRLPVDPSDVHLGGFPKSGTTWLQHLVWYIATQKFDCEESIDYRVPIPEMAPPYPPRPENMDQFIERAPPRFFKSHFPFDFFPKEVLKGKVIYVYRNLKDVIVSNFHHCRAMLPVCYEGTFEQFFNMFMEQRIWYGPWHKHVKSFYKASKEHPESVLLISYEELKKDRMAAIKKLAKFMAKDLSEEMFQKIYDATSFEATKKNETGNYSWLVDMGIWDRNGGALE